MRPLDLQVIGGELAVKWEDGSESYVSLERLRRGCPCAGCQGEKDIFGNVYGGVAKELKPGAFQLVRMVPVGGYAVQPVWGDGHNTGLYAFEYLRRLTLEPPTSG